MINDKPEYIFEIKDKNFNLMKDELKKQEKIEKLKKKVFYVSILCLLTSAFGNLLNTIAVRYHTSWLYWVATAFFFTSIGFFVAFLLINTKIKKLFD